MILTDFGCRLRRLQIGLTPTRSASEEPRWRFGLVWHCCLATFTFGAILGPGLFPVGDALGVKDTADDMVANPRQIAHAAPPDQDDGVFLEVMAFARDISRHLNAVG